MLCNFGIHAPSEEIIVLIGIVDKYLTPFISKQSPEAWMNHFTIGCYVKIQLPGYYGTCLTKIQNQQKCINVDQEGFHGCAETWVNFHITFRHTYSNCGHLPTCTADKLGVTNDVIISSAIWYQLKPYINHEYTRITLCLIKDSMKDCLIHLVMIISACW